MSSPAASPQSAPATDRAAPRRPRCQRCNFQHDVMDSLVEFEPGQPAAMQLGPGRPPIMAPLAQQKPAELMACPARALHRVEPHPYQIRSRVASRPRTSGTYAPVTRRHDAAAPGSRHPAGPGFTRSPARLGISDAATRTRRSLNTTAARPRLIPQPQLHAVAAELAQQTI